MTAWGKLIATTGSLANTVGANQPFRYRGYVYDTETGWYYLQSRYYDPTTCRFISADVYLSTGQGVIGHNSFAYCLNTPICTIDANGSKAIPNIITWDDLPYFSFIHIAVQLHVIYNNAPAMAISKEVEVTMPDGFTGRIDLYERSTGKMWEVKPVGSALIGAEQLTYYSSGVVDNAIMPNQIGGYIPSSQFDIGFIHVSYWYEGSGVILYSFHPSEVPVVVPDPVPEYYPKRWEETFRIPSPASATNAVGALVGVCCLTACYAFAHRGGNRGITTTVLCLI